MSETIAAVQSIRRGPAVGSRLSEAMRVAREIVNNPQISADVRAIAASVLQRHGLPLKLDS